MGLISFDIDGTMAFGDPVGRIGIEAVIKAKELGFIVGSASDRTLDAQTKHWDNAGVGVDFVSLKHRLVDVKVQFPEGPHLHNGDSEMDRFFATQAGFDFMWVHELPNDGSLEWPGLVRKLDREEPDYRN
mgnify:CR=1 FL=1